MKLLYIEVQKIFQAKPLMLNLQFFPKHLSQILEQATKEMLQIELKLPQLIFPQDLDSQRE